MNFTIPSVFIGFLMFLVAGVFFKNLVAQSGKKSKKETQQYLNDEHEANFARAREIPEELLYRPDISTLPDTNYGETTEFTKLNQAKQKALLAAQATMLRLNPPMKNIEIKQKFGTANLEKITNYEVAYEQYIRLLTNWAEELIKLELYEDAKKVLTVCVEMYSLIFLTYSLLCDIYATENNTAALESLKTKIISTPIIANEKILFNKIINYANEKLDAIESE